MKLRVVLGLLVAHSALYAQLQLSSLSGPDDRESPVLNYLDAGAVAVGSPVEMRLRLRNTSTANAALSILRITGPGFSLIGQPALPFVMVPGSNVDFSLRFGPSGPGAFSAALIVNSTSLLVTATGYATAQIGVRDGNSTVTLSPGTPYDFGQIERGGAVTRRFLLRNASSSPLSVASLMLSGSAFRWTGQPVVPLTLASQAEASFDITCEPVGAGPQQGLLMLDNRAYPLTAFSIEPAFPRPILQTDQAAPVSGQQIKLSVRMANASRAAGEGTLSLTVQPLSNGLPDDSGIQFVANGKRTISFQVRQGDTQAQFSGLPSVTLQTGTTAATLQLTAKLGGFTETLLLPIGFALPFSDTTTTGRTETELQVQVAGFDNTRSLSQVAFTFYDVLGTALPSGVVRLDASREFRDYFAASTSGGLFLLRVSFPVTGSIRLIGSVEIQLTSGAGTRRIERVGF